MTESKRSQFTFILPKTLHGCYLLAVEENRMMAEELEGAAHKEAAEWSDQNALSECQELVWSRGNLLMLIMVIRWQFASHFVGFELCCSELVYDLIHSRRSLLFEFHLNKQVKGRDAKIIIRFLSMSNLSIFEEYNYILVSWCIMKLFSVICIIFLQS